MKRILIVDDEESIRKSLGGILSDEGYAVISKGSGTEGLKAFREKSPNAVLLDIWLPDRDGTGLLKEMLSIDRNIPVIMISGHSDISTAINTIKTGAYDFIEKPLSLERVLITVENALKLNDASEKKSAMAGSASADIEIIGEFEEMKRLNEKILKVAPSDAPVLITGENGTGKEMVAKLLHSKSLRKDEPFIAVNSAAIPEELVESEIFGHEKGAFTGATGKKKGRFELADGGTLFLDEIGDMSPRMQSKILRVLQDGKFQRVGGESDITVNVRVIAATNKNLELEIEKGFFRSDLFFRLNVINFRVPPLRERREDIPLLALFFLKIFDRGHKISFEEGALDLLKKYDFPGNVRELKNIIERLSILNPGGMITKKELEEELRIKPALARAAEAGDEPELTLSFRDAKESFEKRYLSFKLKENNYNITRTAENINMSRRNLQKRMAALKIDIPPA